MTINTELPTEPKLADVIETLRPFAKLYAGHYAGMPLEATVAHTADDHGINRKVCGYHLRDAALIVAQYDQAQSPVYGPYRQDELERAFDRVRDWRDWKAPIVRKRIALEHLQVTIAAIIHFTATEPTINEMGETGVIISAAGYRAGPAGDH